MGMYTGIVYAAHLLQSGGFASQKGTHGYLLFLFLGYPSEFNKQKFSNIQYSITVVPLALIIFFDLY